MVNFFTSRVFLQLPSLAHKEFIIAFLPHYAALSGPRCQCWLIKLHPKYDFFRIGAEHLKQSYVRALSLSIPPPHWIGRHFEMA